METDRNFQTTAGQKSRSTGTVDQPFAPDSIVPTHEPPKAGTRYRITKLHRSGGLGRVWVARDEALGRDVALKDLHPERAADSRLRNRFVEEARITGQLEHPYIVPLYDLIDGPNGPCYTMRFAAGKTLAEAAREYHARRTEGKATALDLAGLLDAFVAVCRAVAYAHSRNVLHRDLKGQNVVLGEYGEVFVLDWGLAKIAPGQAATAPTESSEVSPAMVTPSPVGPRDETMSGSILGTPAFLAPEQVGGCPASTATDVYALGAMLYVILTGNPPYEGPTVQDVLEQVSAGPPRPPRTLNPNCPAALEAVCRKAMAREATKRYSNAEALAADVRRWQADEPVEAYREPWSRRVARWARRHRPAVIGAAAVLMTAVFALAISTTLIWREERRTASERDRAEANLTTASSLAMNLLEISDKFATSPESQPARRETTNSSLATFRSILSQRPDDTKLKRNVAKARHYEANFHRLVGENDAANLAYSESINILNDLTEQNPDVASFENDLAEVLRDHAQLLRRLGKLSEAVSRGHRAAKISEELVAANPERALYRRTLATGLIDLSGYEYARAQFELSAASARRSADLFGKLVQASAGKRPSPDILFQAMALHRLAIALADLKQLPESVTESDNALDALKVLSPKDNNVQHFRGRILAERAKALLRMQTRLPEAKKNVEEALVIWTGLQERYPYALYREWQAMAYEVAGQILLELGEKEQARQQLEKSLIMSEKLVEESPKLPDYRTLVARVCFTRGRLAAANKQPAEANRWFVRARDAYQDALDRSPESVLDQRGLQKAKDQLAGAAAPAKQTNEAGRLPGPS